MTINLSKTFSFLSQLEEGWPRPVLSVFDRFPTSSDAVTVNPSSDRVYAYKGKVAMAARKAAVLHLKRFAQSR